MNNCFFCEVGSKRDCYIFENGSFIAHLSHGPINPGHIELFSKRHIENILELNQTEQAELIPAIQQTIDLVKEINFRDFYTKRLTGENQIYIQKYAQIMLGLKYIDTKPTGYNIGINQGISAGQTVMHLHIHIVPRFDNDVADPTGGVRNFLNDLGNYKKLL